MDITEETAVRNSKGSFAIPYPGGKLNLSINTAVMGVINITPDSFSDGGDFFSPDAAVEQAHRLVDEGAHIIDIGGESTRPGSDPVSIEEETERVLPVIEKLISTIPVPVSIDTYKPEVAEAALKAGAKMLNDVSGLREDTGMAHLAVEYEVPIILMHMKGKPKTMQENPVYENLVLEIYNSLAQSAAMAREAGVEKNRIILDPGIGFGKSFEDNLVLLNRLHEFTRLGFPICIGVSRKAFIGATLGIQKPEDGLMGSITASVIAVRDGANIVRTHDVRETVQAVKLADAISTGKLPGEA